MPTTAPTAIPTGTPESIPTATPIPPSVPDEIYDRLSALETLMATLQGLIAALESRIAALEADNTSEPDSTPTPIPTSQPTLTPQPTATPLPPGATPEPTATMAPTATPTPVPNPCELDLPAAGALPVTVEGSWIEECVYPLDLGDSVAGGDRYYRSVAFTATVVASDWIATLTSEQDTYLILWKWDEDAEEYVRLTENDDITLGNTNSRIEWTLVQGQDYLLDLTTYTANTLGDFTLTLESSTASGQNSQGLSQQDFSGDVERQHR